jgi:large subunit ribosomal protein L4e
MARGHKINKVPELPLVLNDDVLTKATKTVNAVKALENLGVYADILKVRSKRTLRKGHAQRRGRKYHHRRGPIIVHAAPHSKVRGFT